MAVEKVQLGVSQIKELLDNGYTWLKKDDLGFGSIQEKYGANDMQVMTIRKHPLLKDLDTTARIFIIIDDTKTVANAPINEPAKNAVPAEPVAQADTTRAIKDSQQVSRPQESVASEFSAFVNL
jgi:hypothetical protein